MASFPPGGNPRNLRKFQFLLLEVPAVASEVLSASKLVDSAVAKSSPTVRPATGCLTGMPGPRSITSIATPRYGSSKIHAEVEDPVVPVLRVSVANGKLVAYSQGPR
jgi:hypothetical protein